MQIDHVTKDELEIFRQKLLEDLLTILKPKPSVQKKWIKGAEVRAILNISAGTLQTLRINGKLNPSKIGGSYYYPMEQIEKLLEPKI